VMAVCLWISRMSRLQLQSVPSRFLFDFLEAKPRSRSLTGYTFFLAFACRILAFACRIVDQPGPGGARRLPVGLTCGVAGKVGSDRHRL
jgi:hypothetical protein